MSQTEDALNEWGMEFINQIDAKVQEPGNEELKDFWIEGDFDGAFEGLKKIYPEVTEDQWSWVEDFLSEI